MGVIAAVAVGVVLLTGLAMVLAVTERGLSEEPVDRVDAGLPDDGPVRAADIPGLRFRIGLRGYRMDDVDAALERIRETLLDSEGGPEVDEDVDAAAVGVSGEPAAGEG